MWGKDTHIEECKSKSVVRLIVAYVPWVEIMIQILDKYFYIFRIFFFLASKYTLTLLIKSHSSVQPIFAYPNSVGLNMPFLKIYLVLF